MLPEPSVACPRVATSPAPWSRGLVRGGSWVSPQDRGQAPRLRSFDAGDLVALQEGNSGQGRGILCDGEVEDAELPRSPPRQLLAREVQGSSGGTPRAVCVPFVSRPRPA